MSAAVHVVTDADAEAGEEGGVFAGFEAEGAAVFFLERSAEGGGDGAYVGGYDEAFGGSGIGECAVAERGFSDLI